MVAGITKQVRDTVDAKLADLIKQKPFLSKMLIDLEEFDLGELPLMIDGVEVLSFLPSSATLPTLLPKANYLCASTSATRARAHTHTNTRTDTQVQHNLSVFPAAF